jgi:hypothetical protein
MIPRHSTERLDFNHTGPSRSAYWNARASSLSPTRTIGRPWSLTRFLRTIINWGRRDRYFDTGESGETYDAEMEAAAAGI